MNKKRKKERKTHGDWNTSIINNNIDTILRSSSQITMPLNRWYLLGIIIIIIIMIIRVARNDS